MVKGFGAQLYTVRDYAKTPQEIANAFEKVAQIGYRSVQVSGLGEIDPGSLNEIARKNNIEIALTHTPPDRLRSCLKQVMLDHERFGCRIVGLGSMPADYRNKGAEGYRDFIRDFRPVAAELGRNGFTFAYHNHAFEFVKYDNTTGMDMLIAGLDCPGFKLTLDTYWAHFGGADCTAFIEKYAGVIEVVHLKDMAATEDNGNEITELGNGNMNWAGIIGAAKKQGIRWYMVEQDTCKGNPFDSLGISYRYIEQSGLLAEDR